MCKSPPPAIPEPPSQPICDPTTIYTLQLTADWWESGVHYYWSVSYDLFWNEISNGWINAVYPGPYQSDAWLIIDDTPCTTLTFDLFVTHDEGAIIHGTKTLIGCGLTTPHTFTFPPWTALFPGEGILIAQLTANAP